MASFINMPDNEEDDQPVIQEDDGEEDDMTNELSSADDESVQTNDNDDLEDGGSVHDGDVQVQLHAAMDLTKSDKAPGDTEVSSSGIRLVAAESGSLPLDMSLVGNQGFVSVQGSVPLEGESDVPTRLADENTVEEQLSNPNEIEDGNIIDEASTDDHPNLEQEIAHADGNARNVVEQVLADGVDETSTDDRHKLEQGIVRAEENSRDVDEQDSPALTDNALNNEGDEKIPQKPESKPKPFEDVPLQDTKGAQILLSRFSSWRKKANEAVVQNVQAFSQTEIAHQLKSRAEVVKTRAEVAFRSSKVDTSEGKMTPKGEASFISAGEQQISQNDATLGSAEHAESAGPQDDTGVPVPSTTDGRTSPNDDDFSDSSEGSSSSESTSSAEVGLNISASETKESMPAEASMRAAAAALYVRSAASVITDSVSSGFRGRYVEDSEPTPPKKEKQSQTSKILSSRAAEHMQTIIDSLDDSHEYVMLLGQGMLGVNLRQAYLKNRGVYVDFLVEGGAAYNSGVVHAGDVIQKVGNISVAKGTILNVPKTVADSKRPSVLVFSTGQKVETSKVNYIDLAIAMMHQIKEEESKRGVSRMPLRQSTSETEQVGNEEGRVRTPGVGGASGQPRLAQLDTEQCGVETDAQPMSGSDAQQWRVPPPQLDAINPANVPHPSRASKEALATHLAKR